MDFSLALQALVDRIQDMVPDRDPRTRFRHDLEGRLEDMPDERMFVVEPVSIEWLTTMAADGLPFLATINISVLYSKGSVWTNMLHAAEDMEQLFGWLSYKPGQIWGGPSLTVEITDAAITTSDGVRINFITRLVWTKI